MVRPRMDKRWREWLWLFDMLSDAFTVGFIALCIVAGVTQFYDSYTDWGVILPAIVFGILAAITYVLFYTIGEGLEVGELAEERVYKRLKVIEAAETVQWLFNEAETVEEREYWSSVIQTFLRAAEHAEKFNE
jgi:hypothetical protein